MAWVAAFTAISVAATDAAASAVFWSKATVPKTLGAVTQIGATE